MNDIRTARLVQQITQLEEKLLEKEEIIIKYEKLQQTLAETLNEIMREAFK